MSKHLSVVFYCHMHQPFYCEADTGNYHLPWVYLHAMKDYTDMAEILSQLPRAKAVINYVPSLTAQIEDYAAHLREFLNGETNKLNDPLLAALAHKSGNYNSDERSYLLEACFRLNGFGKVITVFFDQNSRPFKDRAAFVIIRCTSFKCSMSRIYHCSDLIIRRRRRNSNWFLRIFI